MRETLLRTVHNDAGMSGSLGYSKRIYSFVAVVVILSLIIGFGQSHNQPATPTVYTLAYTARVPGVGAPNPSMAYLPPPVEASAHVAAITADLPAAQISLEPASQPPAHPVEVATLPAGPSILDVIPTVQIPNSLASLLGTSTVTVFDIAQVEHLWSAILVSTLPVPYAQMPTDLHNVQALQIVTTPMVTTTTEVTTTKTITPIEPLHLAPVPPLDRSTKLPDSSAALIAVEFAREQIGKPYVWGATGPDSFDCSGLVQAAYAQAGISLPRVTDQQINAGDPVKTLLPGDLIFALDKTDPNYYPGEQTTHVGMWDGSAIINAATPLVGVIREPFSFWWRAHFVGVRRLPGALQPGYTPKPIPPTIVLPSPTPTDIKVAASKIVIPTATTTPTTTPVVVAVVNSTAKNATSANTNVASNPGGTNTANTTNIPSPANTTVTNNPANTGNATNNTKQSMNVPVPVAPATPTLVPSPSPSPTPSPTKQVKPTDVIVSVAPVAANPVPATTNAQFSAWKKSDSGGTYIIVHSSAAWLSVSLVSSVSSDVITYVKSYQASGGYEWQFKVSAKDSAPRTYYFWSAGVLRYTFKP